MIEICNLVKRYGELIAVDDISFSVQPGEVLGFLGPNGAGKSTTMKMLAGFLAPTSGSAQVCGFDVGSQALDAKRQIGYLPEGAPSYGEMTVLAFLNFVAEIRAMERSTRAQRIGDVVERLRLGSVLQQPIETLSKGFKRRVGLAQAIVHDPRVLILDEPTDGLDPNQKHEVRSLIQDMSADRTLIISTHILEEVHAVCTRAIIIAGGRLLADETPMALETRSRYHGAVSLSSPSVQEISSALKALPGVASVEIDPQDQRITAFPRSGQALFEPISALLRERGWTISELQLERGRLDEVFRQITVNDTPARAAA